MGRVQVTTVTIPITLTIDGVAVPSSMTIDPSLLPAGPMGKTGPAYVPPVLPPAPTKLTMKIGIATVTLGWT